MKDTTVANVISAGLDFKADFVEIYVEEKRSSAMTFKDKKVEGASAGIDFGIGIRMLYGTEVLYGYTSSREEKDLLNLIAELAATRKIKSKAKGGSFLISKQSVTNNHRIAVEPASVKSDLKVDILRRADETARAHSPLVQQLTASVTDSDKRVLIANSEGLYKSDRRVLSRFLVSVTAAEGDELFTGSETPGAMKGFEFFENLNFDFHVRRAADRALLMLNAGYIDGGKMPVIMGNAFGGVIFHEACGHPLETEAIRKDASPYADKLNKRIGQDCLTAVDDGTIANSWGSINIDDEGMETCKTTLIENGILKNFLADRVGSMEVGVPRTASGRRESYRYAPVARMRNTYIAPGTSSMEDMLNSTENGIYAKVMGGGSVNPATGEFNFSVQEAYEIKNGEIGRPVRGATLIGKGHEILPEISMVGKDLELAAGICGASSGSVPVTVGQPSLKVDRILVGGR